MSFFNERSRICQLCLQEGELRNSHVFPDFFIRQMEFPEGGSGQPHVMVASNGGRNQGIAAKQRGSWERAEGIKERLLCAECEQRFSKWEGYARDVLYGNAPPPCPKVKIGEDVPYVGPSGVGLGRRAVLEYAPFKLFQLSMLFRASVARGPMFQYVNLGERHTSRIRAMLLQSDPGGQLDYPCCLTSYEDEGFGYEDICDTPRRERDVKRGNFYRFTLGGYAWVYFVSNEKPQAAEDAIRESGVMLIRVMSGRAFMDQMMANLDRMDPGWVRENLPGPRRRG